MTKFNIAGLMALTLLTACSTTPVFETEDAALHLTPQLVQTNPETARGSTVVWGGIILASTNLEQTTQLEILAYPLNNKQKPQTDQPPLGRFLVLQSGYLETRDYAPGRVVTVLGQVGEIREGRIGETDYTYPVVEPTRLHLWRGPGGRPDTQLHFGVGVVFSN